MTISKIRWNDPLDPVDIHGHCIDATCNSKNGYTLYMSFLRFTDKTSS